MPGKLRCKCDGEAWINRWKLEDMERPRAGMQFMGMGAWGLGRVGVNGGGEKCRRGSKEGRGLGGLSNTS